MSEELPSTYDRLQEIMDAGIKASAEDREITRRILREGAILRTIGAVLIMGRDTAAQQILKLDLSDASALVKASRAQGLLEGQQKFVEALLDFLEETENE